MAFIAEAEGPQLVRCGPQYGGGPNSRSVGRDRLRFTFKNADRADPRLDIVGKADLKGLPPFTVVIAQIDPLHDDGKMLADKIKAAGGTVTYRDYPGVTHEFFGMSSVVAKAKEAETAVIGDLKAAFGGTATGTTAPRP